MMGYVRSCLTATPLLAILILGVRSCQAQDRPREETNPQFQVEKTDRKPGPVMDASTIRADLKSHDRALYIKSGWIRDPYIVLGPDDWYYLTGTQPNRDDPREAADPYNIGLGTASIVGEQVRVYRSRDLIEWESLGEPFTLADTWQVRHDHQQPRNRVIWAPEIHWLGDRWALVHCPQVLASLALTNGPALKGPWTHPMGEHLGDRHDPSLFRDDDGTWYLLWQNTLLAPLSSDFTRYTAEPVRIDPAGSRPGPDGKPISQIGHEGATLRKIGGKYIHFGTAWSTDRGRKGSYNLYYCVADKITGPYGPRKFAGRFLGHGTPFQARDGQWWCTAFFNGNVPPLPKEGIATRDLGANAQTINEQGVTIVPLDVQVRPDGDIDIRAIDPAYGTPGPDEAQQFDPPKSANLSADMSPNKRCVQTYMESFRRLDHAAVLACLTDDVDWIIPGAFEIHGKTAFDNEIENPAFKGKPDIRVARLTEEGDVVVAEGSVRCERAEGGILHVVFCDVFEMREGKIRRLTSYLMELTGDVPATK